MLETANFLSKCIVTSIGWVVLAYSTAIVRVFTPMPLLAPTTSKYTAAAASYAMLTHSLIVCGSQVVHARFMFDGFMYLSCEQAFQAAKFAKRSPARLAIEAAVPNDGESDEEFGNTCWCMGQGCDCRRADWDVVKVKVMLAVNRAKYAQHKELQLHLLSTLPYKLHGNPGTTSWTYFGKNHSW
jgi:predicted NAD-dependent protein-ADP-ribosyltransferase YbiA (DUF1768 family)